jgi:predicted RNA-binding Zn-ribbon protein involved in translation (DUF1610 family)
VVSFACPGCGNTIKARAALAGKKGKCPQCGKAIQVPVREDSSRERFSL